MIPKPGQTIITPDEYKNLNKKGKQPRKNKFGAVKFTTGGQTYDSTKEGLQAQQYEFQKKLPTGHPDRVISFETQVEFTFIVNGIVIGSYILDFWVVYETRIEAVDVKGMKEGTVFEFFKWKARLMKALYNVTVIIK